ncbi:MAG: hypothetical protein HC884_11275 [Chloroflexaceae bacterium]|nr:hypothetical protein [Chloroflexaceae bacterium]
MATRAYMPERITQDVDILIHAEHEWRARAALVAAGYRIEGEFSIGGFSVRGMAADEGAPPLDVLTSRAPWVEQALNQPGYDEAGLPVMPRPYLILLKLQAGHLRDLDDVQRMLRDTPPEERQAIRLLVARYAPDGVEDYDILVQLADIEFGAAP